MTVWPKEADPGWPEESGVRRVGMILRRNSSTRGQRDELEPHSFSGSLVRCRGQTNTNNSVYVTAPRNRRRFTNLV